jgi:FkbM family methyltransferase
MQICNLKKRQCLQHVFFVLPKFLRRHAAIKFLNAIIPGTNCQLIHYNRGARAFVDISDANPRNYFLKGIFEPDLISIAAGLSHAHCIDLDIGANFGLWGLGLISNKDYKGRGVHFFEPNPHCYGFISKSLCELYSLGASVANNVAVGADNGEAYLSINKEELGQSRISKFAKGVKSRVVKIDSYLDSLGDQSIGIVKVDVEGFEFEVVKGMKDVLANNPPRAFILECYDSHLQAYGTNAQELMTRMKQAGYSLFLFRAKDNQNKLFAACPRFVLDTVGCPPMISLKSLPEYGTDILAVRNDICESMLCQEQV